MDLMETPKMKSSFEKEAVNSLWATGVCIVLGLVMNFLPLDRKTSGYIGWLVFLPAFLISFVLAVKVLVNRFFLRRPIRWVYVVAVLPPILYTAIAVIGICLDD